MEGSELNGDHLKRRRLELKMTLEEVGNIVGVGKSTVRKWETGDIENMKRDKISLLAKALRTSPLYIMGLTDDPEASSSRERNTIPLVGTICAGDGLLAEQNIEEYIYYPFPSKRRPDFALRVKGDSMIGAGIEDGDIVYMRQASWADYNGQIVAALINDQEDGTLKRIRWSTDSPFIRLEPENDEYSVIEVLPNQIKICGLYMGHFKPEKELT
jgi:repressor LexA